MALTFDAGSDRGYAAAILDTLRAERIEASFGMTGSWARANPDLVRRMVNEGHQLINHTDHHPSFTGLSTGEAPLSSPARVAELAGAESAVAAAGGGPMSPWFRPPYGDVDASVLRDVGGAGYRWAVMWSVDSLGWKGESADGITQRCLERAEPGAILLFHVGSASQDSAALPKVIAGLRAKGYTFRRVDHLMAGT